MTMSQQKYLLIYRTPATESPPPSPEQMQAMLAQWGEWKSKFKSEIIDMGDGLKSSGKTLASGVVTDGPYVESKEVVGGFSIVSASSYEHALEVARSCPIAYIPGAKIEIREMAGL